MTVTGDALTGYRIELITLVKEIDLTGNQNTIITGLKTAIGVLPTSEHGNADYLVLETLRPGRSSAGRAFCSASALQLVRRQLSPVA